MKSDQGVTQILLTLDCVLGILFIATMLVHLTGVTVHEWLSLVFLLPMLIHLLFHWDWVLRLPARVFNGQRGSWRLNSVLDIVLYALMCFSIVSGVLASRVALPELGMPIVEDSFWTATHHKFSNLLFPLVGVHLALHWPWLKHAFAKSAPSTRRADPGESLEDSAG